MRNFKALLTCGRVVALVSAMIFSSIVGCTGEPEKISAGPPAGAPSPDGGVEAGPKGAAPRVPRGPGQLKALQESTEKK